MDLISNNPDFSSILQVGGKIFGVTHFESPRPGVAYVAEYEQDTATGMLTVNDLCSAVASACARSSGRPVATLTPCLTPQ